MSHVASLRVVITAVVATSLTALTLSLLDSGAARAEDTCLAAPKGSAPAGSHWRYRLERGTQRKCWHLVANGRQADARQADSTQAETQKAEPQRNDRPKGRNAALRAVLPAQDDAQPQAEKLTQTEPQPGPAPINDAVQRFMQPLPAGPAAVAAPQSFGNVVAPVQAAPSSPPASPSDTVAAGNGAPDPAPAAVDASPRISTEAATTDTQDTAAPAQPAAPVVVSKRKAPSSDVDTLRMLPFAIGALAASLVAAGFIFASASRRRQDAVVRIVDLNAKMPPRRASRDVASPPLAMREPWQDSFQDSSQDSCRDYSWQNEADDEADALPRRSPARQRAA